MKLELSRALDVHANGARAEQFVPVYLSISRKTIPILPAPAYIAMFVVHTSHLTIFIY